MQGVAHGSEGGRVLQKGRESQGGGDERRENPFLCHCGGEKMLASCMVQQHLMPVSTETGRGSLTPHQMPFAIWAQVGN